jgi:hypothetical protein
MLSTLSGDKTAWLVYPSIGNHSKAKRRSVKTNGLILIGLVLKCPNGPKALTNRFAHYESIAKILRALEELVKSGIAVQCADSHSRHTVPQTALFLADYSEQCTITMVKNGWCS